MTSEFIKLNKKIIIKGKIIAVTGLAIGGSNAAMGIGGVDKAVVRNPTNQQPYIPGSSLKGKMRSLLEIKYGFIGNKAMGQVSNGPSEDNAHSSTKLFGNAAGRKEQKEQVQRPSRIVVRDAFLEQNQVDTDYFKNTELLYTETKTEVVIDRITSRAMPRQMERVPAGARFDFEMVLNIFEKEDEAQLVKDLFTAIKLVQDDYLGGSGSRGSGQVRFEMTHVYERTTQYYSTPFLEGSEEKNVKTEYDQYLSK